jgi:hypothetical protein
MDFGFGGGFGDDLAMDMVDTAIIDTAVMDVGMMDM